MQPATVVKRTLEIDLASEPLAGRLTSDDQAERRFRGWLELFAAVEELRAGAEAQDKTKREENHA
jgi:hypothetical protein